MKHWHIDEVSWDRFDPSKLDPEVVPLVKAAAMVERNAADYVTYLTRVFHDDPDFRAAAEHWGVEETQHGDALGRWGELADRSWNFQDAFARYRAGYKIQLDADASIRGSRSGELIARCMVETGTSSYYSALGDATDEPVLKEVCRLIAADEYRHFKLFYDHLKRYLARENLSFPRRLRVALGRIGESEDDELAYAFHCGNEDASMAYDHDRCIASYMGRAMGFYRISHIERGMGMIFKTIGLDPRGRMADIATKGAWRLLQWRHHRYQQALRRAVNENAGASVQAA
jgi:rubrerythrin